MGHQKELFMMCQKKEGRTCTSVFLMYHEIKHISFSSRYELNIFFSDGRNYKYKQCSTLCIKTTQTFQRTIKSATGKNRNVVTILFFCRNVYAHSCFHSCTREVTTVSRNATACFIMDHGWQSRLARSRYSSLHCDMIWFMNKASVDMKCYKKDGIISQPLAPLSPVDNNTSHIQNLDYHDIYYAFTMVVYRPIVLSPG